MNTAPIFSHTTFHFDKGQEWLPLLQEILSGEHPGLLATVDQHGQPQMRWMSTLSLEFYPYLYAVTSSTARKVKEIQANPAVTWMFFNQDLSFIVTLRGKARVLTDMPSIRSVFRQLSENLRSNFVDRYLADLKMAVLETVIESFECASPANSFRYAASAGQLSLGHKRLESFEDHSTLDPTDAPRGLVR